MADKNKSQVIIETVSQNTDAIKNLTKDMQTMQNAVQSTIQGMNAVLNNVKLNAFVNNFTRAFTMLRGTMKNMILETQNLVSKMTELLNKMPSLEQAISKSQTGTRGGKKTSPPKSSRNADLKDVEDVQKERLARLIRVTRLAERVAREETKLYGNYVSPDTIISRYGGTSIKQIKNFDTKSGQIQYILENLKIERRKQITMLKTLEQEIGFGGLNSSYIRRKAKEFQKLIDKSDQQLIDEMYKGRDQVKITPIDKNSTKPSFGGLNSSYIRRKAKEFDQLIKEAAEEKERQAREIKRIELADYRVGRANLDKFAALATGTLGAIGSPLQPKKPIIREMRKQSQEQYNSIWNKMYNPLESDYLKAGRSLPGKNASQADYDKGIETLESKRVVFDNLKSTLTGMFSILNDIGSRVLDKVQSAFMGIGLAVGMATAAFLGFGTMLKNFGGEVISATENIRGIQIALHGLVQTRQGVKNLLDTALKASEEMPISYENTLQLTKALALISPLRPMLTDTKNLESNFKSLEKIVLGFSQIEPEWGVAGAVFSLREALSGDLLSLKRRFEVPVNLLTTIDGRKLTEVKNNPELVIQALSKYIGEFYSDEMLQESAKQFGNVWSKIIGYMTMAKTKIGEAGFYNVVMDDFIKLQKFIRSFTMSSDFQKLAERVSIALSQAFKSVIGISSGSFSFIGKLFGADIQMGDINKIADLAVKGVEYYAMSLKKLSAIINDKSFRNNVLGIISEGKDMIIDFGKTIYGEFSKFKGYFEDVYGYGEELLNLVGTKGLFYLWLFGPGNLLNLAMNGLKVGLMALSLAGAKTAIVFGSITSAVLAIDEAFTNSKIFGWMETIKQAIGMGNNTPKPLQDINSNAQLDYNNVKQSISQSNLLGMGSGRWEAPESLRLMDLKDSLISPVVNGVYNKEALTQAKTIQSQFNDPDNQDYSFLRGAGNVYGVRIKEAMNLYVDQLTQLDKSFEQATIETNKALKVNKSAIDNIKEQWESFKSFFTGNDVKIPSFGSTDPKEELKKYYRGPNVKMSSNMSEGNASRGLAFIQLLREGGYSDAVISSLADGVHSTKGDFRHDNGFKMDIGSTALKSINSAEGLLNLNKMAIEAGVSQVTLEGDMFLSLVPYLEQLKKENQDLRVAIAGNNENTKGAHLDVTLGRRKNIFDRAAGLPGQAGAIAGKVTGYDPELMPKYLEQSRNEIWENYNYPNKLEANVLKDVDNLMGDLNQSLGNGLKEFNSRFAKGLFGPALEKKILENAQIAINNTKPGAIGYENMSMAGINPMNTFIDMMYKNTHRGPGLTKEKEKEIMDRMQKLAEQAGKVSNFDAWKDLTDEMMAPFGMLKDTQIQRNAEEIQNAFLVMSRTELDPSMKIIFNESSHLDKILTSLVNNGGDINKLFSDIENKNSELYKGMEGDNLKKYYEALNKMRSQMTTGWGKVWRENQNALKDYNMEIARYKMNLDAVSMAESNTAVPVLMGAKNREQAGMSSSALRDRFTKGLQTPVSDVFAIGFKNSITNMKSYGEIVLDWSEGLSTDMFNMFESNFFDTMTGKIANLADMFRSIADTIKNTILKVLSQLASRFVIDIMLNMVGQGSGGGNILSNVIQSFTGGGGGGNGGSGGVVGNLLNLFTSGGSSGSGSKSSGGTSGAGMIAKLVTGGPTALIQQGASSALGAIFGKAATGKTSLTTLLKNGWNNVFGKGGFLATNPWVLPAAAAVGFLTQPGRLFGGTKDHTGEARAAQQASMSTWSDYVGSRSKYSRDYYASGMTNDISKYNFPQGQYYETESGSKWNPFDGAYTRTGHFDDSAFRNSIYGYYNLLDRAAETHFNKLYEIEKLKEKNEIAGAKKEIQVKQEYLDIIEKQYKESMDIGDWTTTNDLRDTVYQTRIEIDKLNSALEETQIQTQISRSEYENYINSGKGGMEVKYATQAFKDATNRFNDDVNAGRIEVETQEWYDTKLSLLKQEQELSQLIFDTIKKYKSQVEENTSKIFGMNLTSTQRQTLTSKNKEYLGLQMATDFGNLSYTKTERLMREIQNPEYQRILTARQQRGSGYGIAETNDLIDLVATISTKSSEQSWMEGLMPAKLQVGGTIVDSNLRMNDEDLASGRAKLYDVGNLMYNKDEMKKYLADTDHLVRALAALSIPPETIEMFKNMKIIFKDGKAFSSEIFENNMRQGGVSPTLMEEYFTDKTITLGKDSKMKDLTQFMFDNDYLNDAGIADYIYEMYAQYGQKLKGMIFNTDKDKFMEQFKYGTNAGIDYKKLLLTDNENLFDGKIFKQYLMDRLQKDMDEAQILSIKNDIVDLWNTAFMSPLQQQALQVSKILERLNMPGISDLDRATAEKDLAQIRVSQANDIQTMFMSGLLKPTTSITDRNGMKYYGMDQALSLMNPNNKTLSEEEKQYIYSGISSAYRGASSRREMRQRTSELSPEAISMLGIQSARIGQWIDYSGMRKKYSDKMIHDMSMDDPRLYQSWVREFTTKNAFGNAYDNMVGKTAGQISDYNYNTDYAESMNALNIAYSSNLPNKVDLIDEALKNVTDVITSRATQLSSSMKELINTGFITKAEIAGITLESANAMEQIEALQLKARRGSFKGGILDIAGGSSLSTTEINKIINDVAYMGGVNQLSTQTRYGLFNYGSLAQTDLTQVAGYMQTGNYKDYQDAALSYSIDRAKTRIQGLTEGNDEYYDAQTELFQLMVERAEHLKSKADESTQRMDEMLDSIDRTLKVRIAEERKSARGDIYYIDGVHFEEVINQIRDRVRNQSGDTSELLEVLQNATNNLSNRNRG